MVIRSMAILLVSTLWPLITAAEDAPLFEITTNNSEYILDKSEIKLVSHSDKTSVWVRQQYKIWIDVTTPEKFASLQLSELTIPGFTVVPMQAIRSQDGADGMTHLQTGWLLYANRPGRFDLTLPNIKYIRGGKVQHLFKIPNAMISVRPLPPYVPPTMPIGKIYIDSRLDSGRFLKMNTLYHWDVRLYSNESQPVSFTPVLRQLKQSDELSFFPADTTRSTSAAVSGINAEVTHGIPFKALVNNIINLPELRIQYFDPDSGKIMSTYHRPGNVFSLHISAWLLLAVAFLYMTYKLVRISIAYYQLQMKKRKAIADASLKIVNSSSPEQLRSALRLYASKKGWKHNLVLGNWPKQWPIKKSKLQSFIWATEALSEFSYASNQSDLDFNKMRMAFIDILSIQA